MTNNTVASSALTDAADQLSAEPGYCDASSLTRLLRMVGDPKHEPADPREALDTTPLDPDLPFDLVTNPRRNPYRVKVDPVRTFALLTAWLEELPVDPGNPAAGTRVVGFKENYGRNRKLQAKLNALKMGAYQLIGHFQYPPADLSYEDARKAGRLKPPSREDSFFVVKPDGMQVDEFEKTITGLAFAPDADQHAVILGGPDGIYEVSRTGRRLLGRQLVMSVIQQAYSLMRGHPDRPFVFAGTLRPNSVGAMRSCYAEGLRWFPRLPQETPLTVDQRQIVARLRRMTTIGHKLRGLPGPVARLWTDARALFLDDVPAGGSTPAFNAGWMLAVHDRTTGDLWFMSGLASWSRRRQDVVSMVVVVLADAVQRIRVTLLQPDGSVAAAGDVDVSALVAPAAKVAAIPHIDVGRGRVVAECVLRWFDL